MKYELGDKVRISAYWKKVDTKKMDELADAEYDEETEENVKLNRIEKRYCNEVGYVCGLRNVVETVEYGFGEDYDFDALHWLNGTETLRQVYLVATRMNGFRRVSKEDMVFIS